MAKRLNLLKERIVTYPAKFWKRALAFMIDLIVIDFLISPFTGLLEDLVPVKDYTNIQSYLASNPGISNTLLTVTIFIGLIAIAYFAILEYKFGQTIGKMILKLRVESEIKPQRLYQYVIRSIYMIPVIPFVLFLIIDPIYLLLSKTDKRLLERWSKTKTVEYVRVIK